MMSLIERAAQRLEQLREAGNQVAGELSVPAGSPELVGAQEDDASVIERAARKIRDAQDPGSASGHVAVVPPPARPETRKDAGASSAPAREVEAPQQSTVTAPPPAKPPAAAAASKAKARESGTELRGPTARRSREVEIDFDRLLARGLLTPNTAQSRLANELRVIKRPLINNCVGKSATEVNNARLIMVTSALPGEGKSFISMNLALSIAMERDSTVLLLEGDPTRPALAEMLGIPPARGLMDLLVDPKLDVSDVMIRTNLGRLSFIPAGTRHEHATELLASTVMEGLVQQLYERYPDRILIFDSPPLLAAPEPRVLAQHMGQIVYVVEADQTAQNTVQEAIATIESCPVVMAVLNKASFREEGYYYYSYYSQPE
ncbi:MAG: chromosome partitioning ATPase [Betaproteobacteria bacterium]|nr:chromosome partitioning ATPase [Betaproteobacteria bacterium]